MRSNKADWVAAAECSNSAQAQVVASQLGIEGIPVRVENHGVVPGLEPGSTVLVPAGLLHRAKWLLDQSTVTEAELVYLATKTLPGDNEP